MTLGAAIHRTSLEVTNGPPIAPGTEAVRRTTDAERGSQILLLAMERQFKKLMRRNSGISIHDARLLCMNAVELRP